MKINQNDIFYHIYPLGACDAPKVNDFFSEPQARILRIENWVDYIQSLGATAIYLGPVFESGSHGYDTADYYHLDRRLGTRQDLARLSQNLHARGMNWSWMGSSTMSAGISGLFGTCSKIASIAL